MINANITESLPLVRDVFYAILLQGELVLSLPRLVIRVNSLQDSGVDFTFARRDWSSGALPARPVLHSR